MDESFEYFFIYFFWSFFLFSVQNDPPPIHDAEWTEEIELLLKSWMEKAAGFFSFLKINVILFIKRLHMGPQTFQWILRKIER